MDNLPAHLAGPYFLLFQLPLSQRFSLIKLSQEVSQHWLSGGSDPALREAIFRRIRNGLLSFTAHCYFVQVVQRQHHHRYYTRWHEIFQLPQLYDRVRDEIHDMHDYLALEKTEHVKQQSERVERRLNQIALLLGPPALTLAFLQVVGNAKCITWASNPYVAIIATLAGMFLGGLAWWLLHKR